ncbi:hypothetical protein B6N60_03612 [Richelia sinica FACHB-800]|uniref:Uncharacterized protein n=1 Tax=Richelia sinica FACHB-800 TaxID=1357546 RepID=A0A975TBB9_9NOST|nr:hypothetical protein [Richelia sinica]MBD2664007.1 hypothetical protein [Richelia sinica FACHB-800]QXE24902.1 hypothetical protein B6N60_03612 [Richelia sinica FACHB-800]
MNSQPEEELQRRLEQLEAEIKSAQVVPPEVKTQAKATWFAFNSYVEKFQAWFQGLAGMKKIAVVGGMVLLTVWILQLLFKLVSAAISLALLAVLVYVGYKFFVSSSFQNKQ